MVYAPVESSRCVKNVCRTLHRIVGSSILRGLMTTTLDKLSLSSTGAASIAVVEPWRHSFDTELAYGRRNEVPSTLAGGHAR